jgi:hypothetical protein
MKMRPFLPSLLSYLRVISFAAILALASYVVWKDVFTWHETISTYSNIGENVRGFKSPWHSIYPFFLTCLLSVVGSVSLLRDRRSLNKVRILVEIVYILLVFHLLLNISTVIYYCYDTSHSGPAL